MQSEERGFSSKIGAVRPGMCFLTVKSFHFSERKIDVTGFSLNPSFPLQQNLQKENCILGYLQYGGTLSFHHV